MKKLIVLFLVLAVCLIAVLALGRMLGPDGDQALPGGPNGNGLTNPAQAGPVKVDLNFGRMPLYFIPNKGQMDERVSYYVRGKDKTIYFGPGEVTFSLSNSREEPRNERPTLANRLDQRSVPPKPLGRWTVRLEFIGANENVRPVAEDKTGAVISFFKGKPENWKTGLPTYSRIVYRNLWPGIDLAYSGTINKLKYEFIVHPGADPSKISLRYRGPEKVKLNAEGRLEVITPVAAFQDDSPVAWQESGGARRSVDVSYDLAAEPSSAARERTFDFSLKVGSYDKSQTLILDPATIVYCGYVGGSLDERCTGISVDSGGNAYISGWTVSGATGFPVVSGPDLTSNGNTDAFVAKVNSTGTALIYCGYIGGAGNDWGFAVAVNSSGNAFIVGDTFSDETTFPVIGGPDLTYNGGEGDAFVAKVNATGTSLLYCGYIGGSLSDSAPGVAVDSLGRAFVCGSTQSSAATFPVRGGPDLTHNGETDAFIAKVNTSGTSLIYCGYIGGAQWDRAEAIAVDSSGNAYACGTTQSTETTFPVLLGPDLTHNGGRDAFVAKVDYTGTKMAFCGYMGGTGDDYGNALALDRSGCAYIGGQTGSDESSFPTLIGPDLAYNGGTCDAFVAKVNSSGMGLAYCGYIGGASIEAVHEIAVDSRGCAFAAGTTCSDEATFPLNGAFDVTYGPPAEAFVARVGATGRGLSYCSYLGGDYADRGWGIALDSSFSAYVAGETASDEGTGFPVQTGPDLSYNGNYDGFVAKVRWIPELIIVAPIGGERWVVGSTHKIEWTTEDKKGYNKIELSTDKGQTWSTIAAGTPDDGSFKWLVPNKVSKACLIRITQKENGQYDISDQPFEIVPPPKITVTSPNGGEVWSGYDQRFIAWTTQGIVGDVKIEYSLNAGTTWLTAVAQTANTGSWMWVVPNTPSNKCLARISEAGDGIPKDKSNAVFTILPAAD